MQSILNTHDLGVTLGQGSSTRMVIGGGLYLVIVGLLGLGLLLDVLHAASSSTFSPAPLVVLASIGGVVALATAGPRYQAVTGLGMLCVGIATTIVLAGHPDTGSGLGPAPAITRVSGAAGGYGFLFAAALLLTALVEWAGEGVRFRAVGRRTH